MSHPRHNDTRHAPSENETKTHLLAVLIADKELRNCRSSLRRRDVAVKQNDEFLQDAGLGKKRRMLAGIREIFA